MAEIKWFKVLTDMFSDDKIKIIQSMPEGDALIVMWFKVLAQAGKTNDGGYIYLKKNIPYTPGMLATLFNKPQQSVEFALRTFSEFGMIDMDDHGYIFITNWEKHQNIEGMDKVREQTRLRNAKYREKKRLELMDGDVSRDVTVTEDDATDKELELDKEKDKNICVFESYTSDPELIETLKEFVKFRKKIKSPMTDRAIELMLGQLNKLTNDEGEKAAILNQSIVNSWKGVFALKGGYTKPAKEEKVMSMAEWQALEKRRKEEAAARMVNDL